MIGKVTARSSEMLGTVLLGLFGAFAGLARADDSRPPTDVGPRQGDTQIDLDDLSTLTDAKLRDDSESLVAFFRQQAARSSRKCIEAAIRGLGDPEFAVRQAAAADLQAVGKRAVPSLRKALGDSDLEIARRAREILGAVELAPGPAVAEAAARVLAARRAAGAVQAIISYLPLAEDPQEEDELLRALGMLAPNDDPAAKAVLAALTDDEPLRRAGAAVVAGKSKSEEKMRLVSPLLKDADARVRFQASLALLQAEPKTAVPVLLALLEDGPLPLAWKVEGLLESIAGKGAPTSKLLATADSRRTARSAWQAWWKEKSGQVDFSRGTPEEQTQRCILLADLDEGFIQAYSPDFEPRWRLNDLTGPVDCQFLPNGHVLVAENHAERITERDRRGKLMWETKLHGPPRTCQRLDNGNTFTVIVKTRELLEIAPEGTVAWSQKLDDVPYFARKLRDGRIAVLTWQGGAEFTSPSQLLFLSAEGKQLASRKLPDSTHGTWPSFTVLPSGNFLIAGCCMDRLLEVSPGGAVKWGCNAPDSVCAARLPNGDTLAAIGWDQRLLQFDRSGKIIRATKMDGRPWFVGFAK